jgi:hypothetical protein
MAMAQGTITLEVSMEKGKLEKLLEVIRQINDNNVELYDVNIPTGTELHNLRVDDVRVEWVDIIDENGLQMFAEDEDKLTA